MVAAAGCAEQHAGRLAVLEGDQRDPVGLVHEGSTVGPPPARPQLDAMKERVSALRDGTRVPNTQVAFTPTTAREAPW